MSKPKTAQFAIPYHGPDRWTPPAYPQKPTPDTFDITPKWQEFAAKYIAETDDKSLAAKDIALLDTLALAAAAKKP